MHEGRMSGYFDDSTTHTLLHSVEVMVYQYVKLFGYGWWMTSILTKTHIFIFFGYSEFPSWLPWLPIQILQNPKVYNKIFKCGLWLGY